MMGVLTVVGGAHKEGGVEDCQLDGAWVVQISQHF